MFTGEYQHTLDTKGRFCMSAKSGFLGEFNDYQGLDGCPFVYTKEEWADLEEN